TFRGNNHAFVTATAALRHFWSDDKFSRDINRCGTLLKQGLQHIAGAHGLTTCGRGMMRGINLGSGELAQAVTAACFERGLIIETSGPHDEIVKGLAPMVIEDAQLQAALDILEESICQVLTAHYCMAAE